MRCPLRSSCRRRKCPHRQIRGRRSSDGSRSWKAALFASLASALPPAMGSPASEAAREGGTRTGCSCAGAAGHAVNAPKTKSATAFGFPITPVPRWNCSITLRSTMPSEEVESCTARVQPESTRAVRRSVQRRTRWRAAPPSSLPMQAPSEGIPVDICVQCLTDVDRKLKPNR